MGMEMKATQTDDDDEAAGTMRGGPRAWPWTRTPRSRVGSPGHAPAAACGEGEPASRRAMRSRSCRMGRLARTPAVFGLMATLVLLQCPARARVPQQRDWPSLGGSTLIEIAGETIDTSTAPSVHHEASPRRGAMSNGTFAQYYVQIKPNADQRALRTVLGSSLKVYVPNNAYLVLVSRATALTIARMDGIQWVGERPSRHKVSLSLAEEAAAPYAPKKKRASRGSAGPAGDQNVRSTHSQDYLQNEMDKWERKSVVSLHVTVHTPEDWKDALQAGQEDLARANERSAESFAQRAYQELTSLGLGVLDTYRASDEKVVVRVKPRALRSALEWLGEAPEAVWIEKRRRYYPFMRGSTRLLTDGPSLAAETSDATSMKRLGIDGTGQIIGAADTGLDWDNCFFWQSAKSPIYQKRGVQPPFQVVDRDRRKLISYNWHQDCKVCDRCPLDVDGDSYTFVPANGLLEAEKDKRLKFPEDNSDKRSAIPPRNYDSAGATVKFSVQAVSRGTSSEYTAQGAGAYDIKVDIQVFIVPRAETDTFDPNNPEHYSKCLNDCGRAKGNLVEEELVVLDAANGGYGIIITNRGLEREDGGDTVHALFTLSGKIQFKTALKPCGDNGDDRAGHGTHAVSAAVGAADTPAHSDFDEKMAFASHYNGMAPGAKVYFEDVMQNANSDCNVPGKICPRVNDMTIPVDLANDLFLKPYNEGVRIHLNSWGCKVNEGERPGLCNKYTARSRDVDKFVFEHPDFLPIFAAGENGLYDAEGSVAEPGTCKNCLTVGASNTYQKMYREAAATRDPQTDICGACQYPYFCSRSDMIGSQVMDSPDKLREALEGLPGCCNDTLHEYRRVEDIEVPAQQWFTVHLPHLAWENADAEKYIRERYNWLVDGASLLYDFKAEFASLSETSATSEEPNIQVIVLLREDFYEYFEAGTLSCNEADPPANCRDNPCVTSVEKQQDGTERCMSIDGASYDRVENCKSDGPLWTEYDGLCHKGECGRYDEDSSIRTKDQDGGGKWGMMTSDGCPLDAISGETTEKCCNDKFLYDMCINKIPGFYDCKEVGKRLHRNVREKGRVDMIKKGFGIAVRNMNSAAIKLTGTIEIRQQGYPCTLRECCGDPGVFPQTACCAKEYPRVFAAGEACDQCGPVPAPGVCHPFEVSNLPSWTSRGPGQSNFIDNIGGRQFKPELVAPGTQIVSANSDGSVPDDGEYEVQCDERSRSIFTDQYRCIPSVADEFMNTTSVRAQSGTSVAAAQIAGSAALIRQYLVDGYYPTGLKNASNSLFAQPPASLVKAMLLNSARSVGGNLDTYTYNYPPFCDPTIEICSPWTKPKPQDCPTDSSFENVDCFVRRDQLPKTPSNIEGYGRPILSNVVWTNYSEYSLFIDESFIPQGYQRAYTFPILETSPTSPTKVTLVWTDEPGAPEAENVLVNDLDLIVQLISSQELYNPNQGIRTVVEIFENNYGNAAGKGRLRDRTNVIEEVTLDGVNGNTNVTVLVVGARVPKWVGTADGGQKYSLVVTGQMTPKYQAWNATRQQVLDFVEEHGRGSKYFDIEDDVILYSFNYLDVFKTGFVVAEDLRIRIKVDRATSFAMISEADDSRDGQLDLAEWKQAYLVTRSRSRIPREPMTEFSLADASILDEAAEQDDSMSRAPAMHASVVCSIAMVFLSMAGLAVE